MLGRLARAAPLTVLSRNALGSPHRLSALARQPRYLSSKADDEPSSQQPPQSTTVYEGAKNKIVMTLKLASIANLGFAVASVPLLQYITAATGNEGKGVAMSALLVMFGGGTTGALTWATSTYVLQLRKSGETLSVDTPTLTGGTMTTEVAWPDVGRPIGYHPFVTFEAAGKKFYLDELGEMHDDTFPEKLEEALNK